MTGDPVAALAPGSLAIERIETIALRAPLGRRFTGSAFWRLTSMSTRVADGRYRLPEAPGFGVDFDWDYVRAHMVSTRVSTR